MHLGPEASRTYATKLGSLIAKLPADTEVVICPSSLSLYATKLALGSDSSIALGAQNAYPMDEGAFTGEISFAMLRGVVSYSLVGHSERRHIFKERDNLIAQKMSASLRNDITPILCVGETKYERESGHAHQVVADQLETGLSLLTEEELHDIIIAYEPVWAIGTGENASPDDAREMLERIRKWLAGKYSSTISHTMPILYGGSVDESNAGSYLKLTDCNGLLIGGTSLKEKSFSSIVMNKA